MLAIHPTDHPAGQYPKNLEQNQEEKAMKTTKTVNTIAKVSKLRNTAKSVHFPALLLSFHHLLCFLKKPHSDNKNLLQNPISLFFPHFKPKYRYYFYPL